MDIGYIYDIYCKVQRMHYIFIISGFYQMRCSIFNSFKFKVVDTLISEMISIHQQCFILSMSN